MDGDDSAGQAREGGALKSRRGDFGAKLSASGKRAIDSTR